MFTYYKKFRSSYPKIAEKYTLSKRFDEPTYFSFRLIFATNQDRAYNNAADNAIYDTMPHPLFNTAEGVPSVVEPYNNTPIQNSYSAIKYLENANEPTRMQMLKEFISKFEQLQYEYPYYFQSIDGISDLLKIDTTKGQRITNEKRITITCLEGLDLRMSYLLNLYRKIVWDDTYQRWVLPDMMRYFTLKIYLSEFRTFHLPKFSEQQTVSGYGNELKNGNESTPLYLTVLDDILPTWELNCEMCEFDINDITFDHLSNLSVATMPNQGAVKFAVKIGNVKELQIYPVFQHMFLSDRKLNSINRAREELSTAEENNRNLYPASLQIAQLRDPGNNLNMHQSSMPFNERTNENNLNEADIEQEKVGGTFDVNFNATEPNTWVGNAINFGSSYAKNFVNKIIDKAKVTSIPHLGVSFNEVTAALSAKDIVGALGLIRKGVNEIVNQYGNAPSSRLDQPLQTDVIMKNFLTTISEMTKSDATDDQFSTLQQAANMALSDKGIWEKIKDFSMATNMEGIGEKNIYKDIQNSQDYKLTTDQQSKLNFTSKKIDDNVVLIQPELNLLSGGINQDSKINSEKASEKLISNISESNMNTEKASSRLYSQTENSKIEQGKSSEYLDSTSIENSKIDQIEASDKLSSNISSGEVSSIKSSDSLSKSINSEIKQINPSNELSSEINENTIKTNSEKKTNSSSIENTFAIKTETASVRIKTINATQIIESEPTRIMIKKLEGESIKQPTASKATNSKIEEQNLNNLQESKINNKIPQEELKNVDPGKATNQELFSK